MGRVEVGHVWDIHRYELDATASSHATDSGGRHQTNYRARQGPVGTTYASGRPDATRPRDVPAQELLNGIVHNVTPHRKWGARLAPSAHIVAIFPE